MSIQLHLAEVAYEAPLGAVTLTLKGYNDSKKLRAAAAQALELVRSKNAKYILNDQSASTEMNFDQDDWVISEWFPQLVDMGLEKYAVVVPAAVLDQLPRAMKKASFGRLDVRYFDDVEKARKWLG
jgi:hypothetical protein